MPIKVWLRAVRTAFAPAFVGLYASQALSSSVRSAFAFAAHWKSSGLRWQ